MIIKVLGTGCKKCTQLKQNVEKVIEELKIDASVEKVEDIQKIISYGVMGTPALVIDEEVVSTGKLLKPKEIAKILQG